MVQLHGDELQAVEELAAQWAMTPKTLTWLAVRRLLAQADEIIVREVEIDPTRTGWRSAMQARRLYRREHGLPYEQDDAAVIAWESGRPLKVVLPVVPEMQGGEEPPLPRSQMP